MKSSLTSVKDCDIKTSVSQSSHIKNPSQKHFFKNDKTICMSLFKKDFILSSLILESKC